MSPLQAVLAIVAAIVVPLGWLFAWSLCRAASDHDKFIKEALK